MFIRSLSDGRTIGIKAYEIISLPEINSASENYAQAIESNANLFQRTITEYQKLCNNLNCCAELLWVTEKIEGQAIKSRIRLFLVLRCIAQNTLQTETQMNVVDHQFVTSLKVGQYAFQECVPEMLQTVLEPMAGAPVYAVIKTEKCVGTVMSAFPYYYWDVLPSHSTDNFMILQAELSRMENCCISFQLFPSSLTPAENYCIQEQSAILSKLCIGMGWGPRMMQDQTAQIPQKIMSYYAAQSSSAMFHYNILVNGKAENASLICTRIISLLQSGKESIAPVNCTGINLSTEKLNLSESLLIYPWNINNLLLYKYRNTRLQQSLATAKTLGRLPYLLTADEAASFFRLPMYEKGMSALKSNMTHQDVEQFGSKVTDSSGIEMGAFPENPDSKIYFPPGQFTKHGIIVGMPGSGKTTASIAILLQFARAGIPFLAIEPTKAEYRAMIDVLPDLQIFTPGNNAVSPFIINPFLPPQNIELEKYIPSLLSAFKAAFDMVSPLDILFLSALRTCYTEHGWKDYSKSGDPDVTVFGLREFILCFKKLIRNSGYGKEVKGNLESAGVFRLMNLIEQNGNIYDTIHSVPVEDLLQHPTVLELNAIDNAEQKALIIALLLINICIYTKNNTAGDGKIKNILLIDEAHVLLRNKTAPNDSGPSSQSITVETLQNLIAEIRSYGTGIIIADQRPSQIGKEIIANTDVKIVFRLVESGEKSLVADSMNMDDQLIRQIGSLGVGQAYVYCSLLKAPYKLITRDIRATENIRLSVDDQEIKTRMHYWDRHSEMLCPFRECSWSKACSGTCSFRLRSDADHFMSKFILKNNEKITDEKVLDKYIVNMPVILNEVIKDRNPEDQKKLINCCRIRLLKKIQMDKNLTIPSSHMRKILESEAKEQDNGRV